ncbi:hypothetical protein HDZ31DRAFT_46981 [Schizophyllum fasciatum]
MFIKVAALASSLFFGAATAFNGRAFPLSPNGRVFECGFAVQNNDLAAFASPKRYNESHCGAEIQASSPYGLGDTITPILAGVYTDCKGCGENDIMITPDAYEEASKNLDDQDWISVVWAYKTW